MHTLRLTATDRTEHLVSTDDYDTGVTTGRYRTTCGEQVAPAAMVVGPDRTCRACRQTASPIDWRQPARPGVIERWLRKAAAL